MIVSDSPFDTIENERLSRFAFLRKPDDSVALKFNARAAELDLSESINSALAYAIALDYHHEGLSKQAYFAHPLRVAMMYLDVSTDCNLQGVKLALLHNVLEVSRLSLDTLTHNLGIEIARSIDVLTVNRSLQWDVAYKDDYYRRISESPTFVQQVKVLDKLDNLFVLCLNPSNEIREKYLGEIERWILPLVHQALPLLDNYFAGLVKTNRKIGHIPL